jgi:DMSO/TMAO reductase YedYZ molybdopterin-dependent catalytic subunit
MPRGDHPGLIVRQTAPLNLEYQFSALTDWVVPTNQFYVRNHFPTPKLTEADWRLTISGEVERPMSLSLSEIKAMKPSRLTAVMECAGNGRVFYEPAREGLQWQSGAVGNASWTGIALRDLLDHAGIGQRAVEVILVGADRGVVDGGKKTASPGPIAFARSLPVEKAMSDASLLAYAMNEEPLTPDHGFPLRAVIGGWFGMAWIKWVTEIRVVDRPFLGYWQARDYFRWERGLGEPILVPLGEMEVKAQIARPVSGSTVVVGQAVRIFGAAWSGEAPIESVDIETEPGLWQRATLLPPETRYGWRLFEHHWTPRQAGRHELRCRARDEAGHTQPERQQGDRESYVANWIVPVAVTAVARAEPFVEEFVI